MFKSRGYLVCHPKKMIPMEEFWLALHTDDDLGSYFLHWIRKVQKNSLARIEEPAWGAHVSIVRGETIIQQEYYDKLNGAKLDFWYSFEIEQHNKHFTCAVECPQANSLRKAIGLNPEPSCPFHLTVGVIDNSVQVYDRLDEDTM